MNLFKSKLMNRIAIAKIVGLVFGLLAFIMVPIIFINADIYLRFAILLWYTSIGAFIGVMGIINKHPFLNFSFPFWIRGPFLGGWMNFVLVLFIYDKISFLMQNTAFSGLSPFWLITEGMIVGFVIDLIATKVVGDGKKLIKD
ncbi:MAG: hypothetical protein PHI37_03865 [Candidatus Gracilibacteria bacterium]|nr:hypothetical protein [Candidatus Gracilibacteria bacterium]